MNYTDRIPYQAWINSQLSIARFYGGMNLNGIEYWIEEGTNDLVVKNNTSKKVVSQKRRKINDKNYFEKRAEQRELL